MQKQTSDLGSAPLGPLLLRLSLPGVIGMLTLGLYGVVNSFWVARLGEKDLAALAVAFPWQMVVGALGIAMAVGSSSLVSRRFGEGRGDEANRIAGQGVFLAVAAGLPLVAVALVFPQPLLRLFGATPELLPLARAFFVAAAWGAPFVLFAQASNGLYRGAGNATVPMLLLGGSAVLNMALDPLLIFGLGPFPRMGLAGAGLATALAQLAVGLASASYLWSRSSGFHVRLRHLRPSLPLLQDIGHVGSSNFAMNLLGTLVLSLYNWVLGGFSATAIAAYGLTWRLMMLVFPLVIGAAQGLLPVVGFNFGARQYGRLWQAVGLAARTIAIIAAGLGLLLGVFAPQVVSVFTREPELTHFTVLALRLAVSTLILTGPAVMFISTLQGMGHGGWALLLSMTRQLVFLVPALFLLSRWYGVPGAFAAQPVAETLSFVLCSAVLWRVSRRYRPGKDEGGESPSEVAPSARLAVPDSAPESAPSTR